jgi:MoxR-like ATPase
VNIEKVTELAGRLESSLGQVIRGQAGPIHELVVALVAGGHVLIEGPPGIGKTLMVRAAAGLLESRYKRIQFTPDLMPADITGTSVFRPQSGTFEFVPGPLFSEILLADEINRTPPKTQAALLAAMQEQQVTLDGVSHPLPPFFFVAATQNPLEYEGTYPLPEAQLDRFFMKIRIGYPEREKEREILDCHAKTLELVPPAIRSLEPVAATADLLALRGVIAATYVEDSVLEYIMNLVQASREHRRVAVGASSRAAVILLFAAKSLAACDGREFVRPDDVKEIAPSVLRHRILLRPEAEVEGVDSDQVIMDLLGSVGLPRLGGGETGR